MIEPSMCGGDAALCQIIMALCWPYYRLRLQYHTLFDSRGGFSGTNYPVNIAKIEVLRDVAMATNFGTTVAANGL